MKFTSICAALLLALSLIPVQAKAADEVPSVMGYHAAIQDEGGNSILDGEWSAWFRITDVNGSVLYEEQQRVNAIGGQVSALIGNGLTPDGAPTGGMPFDAIDPSGARYLEVEFEGMEVLPAVELASVPYAGYAQTCFVAAEGSVTYDSLSDGVVDKIAEDLTGGEGISAIIVRSELDSLYSDASSAEAIGVSTSSFDNSTSTDLQGALSDFDGAIESCESGIVSCNNSIAIEETNRVQGDANETSARQTADETINGQISVLQVQTDEIANPNRLSFMRSIWGTVHPDGTFYGANASASNTGMNLYQVTFTQALSDANYAVVATPNHNTNLGSPATLMVYDKTMSGFKVVITPSSSVFRSFDFIVIGN